MPFTRGSEFGGFTYTPVGFEDAGGGKEFTGKFIAEKTSHPNSILFQRCIGWLNEEIESHGLESFSDQIVNNEDETYFDGGLLKVDMYHPNGNKTIYPNLSNNSNYIPMKTLSGNIIHKAPSGLGDYHNMMWANTEVNRQVNDIYYSMMRMLHCEHSDTHTTKGVLSLSTGESYYPYNSLSGSYYHSPTHAVPTYNNFTDSYTNQNYALGLDEDGLVVPISGDLNLEHTHRDSYRRFFPDRQEPTRWSTVGLGSKATFPFTHIGAPVDNGPTFDTTYIYMFNNQSQAPDGGTYLGVQEVLDISYHSYRYSDPLDSSVNYTYVFSNFGETIYDHDNKVNGLPSSALLNIEPYFDSEFYSNDTRQFFQNVALPKFNSSMRLFNGKEAKYFSYSCGIYHFPLSDNSVAPVNGVGTTTHALGGTNRDLTMNCVPGSQGVTGDEFAISIGSPAEESIATTNVYSQLREFNQTELEPYSISGFHYQSYKSPEFTSQLNISDTQVANYAKLTSNCAFSASRGLLYTEDGTNETNIVPDILVDVEYTGEQILNSPCVYTYLGKYSVRNKFGLQDLHFQAGLKDVSETINPISYTNSPINLKYGRVITPEEIETPNYETYYKNTASRITESLDTSEEINQPYGLTPSDKYNIVRADENAPPYNFESVELYILDFFTNDIIYDDRTQLRTRIKFDDGTFFGSIGPSPDCISAQFDFSRIQDYNSEGEYFYIKYDAGNPIEADYNTMIDKTLNNFESDMGLSFDDLYDKLKFKVSDCINLVTVSLGSELFASSYTTNRDLVESVMGSDYLNYWADVPNLNDDQGPWSPDHFRLPRAGESVTFLFNGTSLVSGLYICHIPVDTVATAGFYSRNNAVCVKSISPSDITYSANIIPVDVKYFVDGVATDRKAYFNIAIDDLDFIINGDVEQITSDWFKQLENLVNSNNAQAVGVTGTSSGQRAGLRPYVTSNEELAETIFHFDENYNEHPFDGTLSIDFINYIYEPIDYATAIADYQWRLDNPEYDYTPHKVSTFPQTWTYTDGSSRVVEEPPLATYTRLPCFTDSATCSSWTKKGRITSGPDLGSLLYYGVPANTFSRESIHNISNSDDGSFYIDGEGPYYTRFNESVVSDGFVYTPIVDLNETEHNYLFSGYGYVVDQTVTVDFGGNVTIGEPSYNGFASTFGLVEIRNPVSGDEDNNVTPFGGV